MGKLTMPRLDGKLSGGGFANRTSVLPAKLPAAGPKTAPMPKMPPGQDIYRGRPRGMS